MKKLCLIIPLFLSHLFAFAEYGCLVPGYPELLIYQTNPPGGVFSNNPNIYPNAGCIWVLDTSKPYNGCVGHAKGGIKGTYYEQCPIDDYLPVFFIFTAGIGCISINKRYKIVNEGICNNSSL
ncbi:hypothetical protein [Pedobacter sp. Leaf132]|uniref:hypothetical protein n=1 Tax=Pedobacter sp. Leaf132 TaxID=2876557 RepID=UPI001E2C183A|nr:hypothetical protein [Pedobacter sp. Leaf132]